VEGKDQGAKSEGRRTKSEQSSEAAGLRTTGRRREAQRYQWPGTTRLRTRI